MKASELPTVVKRKHMLPLLTKRFRACLMWSAGPILALCLLPSQLYARIPIEQMQRQLQARFHYGHCYYVSWPACPCGRSAPNFPPDGFYGDLDKDPELAVTLVRDIFGKFYGAPIWAYFVKNTTLEGVTDGHLTGFTSGDFPWPYTSISLTNYADAAALLQSYLSQMVYSSMNNVGLTSIDGLVDGSLGSGSSDNSCDEAITATYGAWSWNFSPRGQLPQAYAAGADAITTNPATGELEHHYSAQIGSIRAQAFCPAVCSPGTVILYLSATNLPSDLVGDTHPGASQFLEGSISACG